jgi:hypothetical protein
MARLLAAPFWLSHIKKLALLAKGAATQQSGCELYAESFVDANQGGDRDFYSVVHPDLLVGIFEGKDTAGGSGVVASARRRTGVALLAKAIAYPFEARKWNKLSVVLPTTVAEKDPTGRSNPNRPI